MEPYAFENDIAIVETIESGETLFSAFAGGMLIERYSSDRAGNAEVATQLAVAALSRRKLCEDLSDIAVWFAETHPDIQAYFVADRYRFQRPYKLISHIVVASKSEVRRETEMIVGEAFQSLGWAIDPNGGSSTEWFDARGTAEMSAHKKLKAVERVQSALDGYRRTRTK